jgi:hypothetical protein
MKAGGTHVEVEEGCLVSSDFGFDLSSVRLWLPCLSRCLLWCAPTTAGTRTPNRGVVVDERDAALQLQVVVEAGFDSATSGL